jgi:hypothetical protein
MYSTSWLVERRPREETWVFQLKMEGHNVAEWRTPSDPCQKDCIFHPVENCWPPFISLKGGNGQEMRDINKTIAYTSF